VADLGGGRVSIWDVAKGRRIRLLSEERDAEKTGVPVIHKLAYSPDGRFLFGDSGGMPGYVLIWKLPDYRLVNVIRNFNFGAAIAFSPDAKWVALSAGRTIRIHAVQR
jgi:WD40 repeat protein